MPRPAVLAAAGCGALTAAWSAPAPAAHLPRWCEGLGISRRADLAPAEVGLTFDDGPHPQGTPAVLDALARGGASATFFVVGEQVRRDPALAREIIAAGHRLAVHGDQHRCQLRLGPAALRADLDSCAALVGELSGGPAALYRPPYGIFSAGGLREVRGRGWTPLLWSRWGRDWRADATPAQIAADCAAGARAGDVVLLHDADHYSAPGSWRRTAAAVPMLLAALGERGLRAAAV